MSKRRHKRRSSFQRAQSKPRFLEADCRVNLDTVLDSWSRFKDSLSTSRPGVEAKRLKNILPTLFQSNQNDLAGEDVGSGSRKNKNPNLLFIDVNKIEENAKLNKYDKEELKTIINYLKYNEEDGNCRKVSKRKNNSSSTATKEKTKQELKISKNMTTLNGKKKISVEKKSTKHVIKNDNFKCKRCSRNLKEKCNTVKRKQRNATTFLETPQQRILQKFAELDPLACGDAWGNNLLKIQRSFGSTSTIFRRNRTVNIQNIAFKYLNPTYVVQYNTNCSEEQFSEDNAEGDRFYSSAAMEAHLGQRPCPDYHHTETQARKQSGAFHYDPSHPYIVGGVNEETLMQRTENREALKPPGVEEEVFVMDCEYSNPAFKHITEAPPENPWKGNIDTYQYFATTFHDVKESIDLKEALKNVSKKKGSKCKTLKEFVQKFFCLPIERSDSSFGQVESPMKRMTKEDFNKRNKIHNSPSKVLKGSNKKNRVKIKTENDKPITPSKFKRVNFDLNHTSKGRANK